MCDKLRPVADWLLPTIQSDRLDLSCLMFAASKNQKKLQVLLRSLTSEAYLVRHLPDSLPQESWGSLHWGAWFKRIGSIATAAAAGEKNMDAKHETIRRTITQWLLPLERGLEVMKNKGGPIDYTKAHTALAKLRKDGLKEKTATKELTDYRESHESALVALGRDLSRHCPQLLRKPYKKLVVEDKP